MRKILFVVNVDWFFISHRLEIGLEAMRAGYEVHIATQFTSRRDELESLGFITHALRIDRGDSNFLGAIFLLFSLIKLFWALRPSIVHLITIKPVLLGGFAAKFSPVKSMVFSISGLGSAFIVNGIMGRIRLAIIRFAYRIAFSSHNIAVITQNPDDGFLLKSFTGVSSNNIIVIRGSGVDLNQFVVSPENCGVPIVLFPARLLASKGIFEFVQASKLLRARGLLVRFVLAGMVDSDNPHSISQSQLDCWVKEGVVEHWGYRNDMPQVIASANLVVLPSYREGLPKALLEAAAAGRAVVTTDVPGCRDAIEPNVTGVLVAVRDAVSLANAIERLLSNSAERNAMGLAGRCLAEKEFDVHAVVDKHLVIYKRLLV